MGWKVNIIKARFLTQTLQTQVIQLQKVNVYKRYINVNYETRTVDPKCTLHHELLKIVLGVVGYTWC